MENKAIEILMVSVDAIAPNPKNNNKHTAEQKERAHKIFDYQGFRNPLTISKRSGLLVAGHLRLEVAKEKGIKELPCMYQDFESEEQEYSHMTADNALQSWSELNLSQINQDFIDLGPFDVDFLGIKDFCIEPLDKLDPQCDEDEIPEHVEPKTKRGDIYKLGNHRLMCADSTMIDDVEKLMDGEKADMVFTDPPYGMRLDADFSKMGGQESEFDKSKKLKNSSGYKNIIGDHEDFSSELINTVFSNFNYCKEIFMFGADYYSEHLTNKNEGSWIVWDKRENADGSNLDGRFGSCFELCWSKNKHKRDIARIKWTGFFGTETQDIKKRIHPTQKPIQLTEWFFNQWGKDTTSVVDLFGGSGSTLIACEKTNRKCFMMELDPHYCDVIISRFEKYTGKKAELLNASF